MKSERGSGEWTGDIPAMVLILVLALPWARAGASDQWRLIPVEVDGVKDTLVADFALGVDGTPWVALARPQRTICYWDGSQWRGLAGDFSVNPYSRQLHVSPAGRVYLDQTEPAGDRAGRTPPKPNHGALYLLTEGRAEYVTDYYYDSPNYSHLLFFDSKGRIWNWGESFFAKFEDGQWERVETAAGPWAQIIEDAAGNVYCFGKTLSYYRDGRFTTNTPLPFSPWERHMPFKGYLWGRDKALFFTPNRHGVVVVDLNSLKVSDVLHSEPLSEGAMRDLYGRSRRRTESPLQNLPPLVRSSLYDAFRDGQGNLWVLGHSPNGPNYLYFKVSAADNSVEEKPETMGIDWGSGMNSRPKPVLCAKDGAMYLGTNGNGVYLYRDGALTHVDWKQGLAINGTDWVCEHPDGTVWFASRRMGVAVYDPRGVPGTGLASPFQKSWEEYLLAAPALVRDFEGCLWCCLKDEPGKVSRWNGRDWEHFDLGITEARPQVLLVDNLQRFHVLAATERERVACRLTDDLIDRFTDFKDMLVDSVRTGAREFRSSGFRPSLNPLVLDDRKIWYADPWVSRLMRYDGTSWHEIRIEPFRTNIFRYKGDQILIGTEGGFMTLDRGQLVAFTDEYTRSQQYLLGESGLQPFDEDLHRSRRSDFFPARQVDRTIYLFEDLRDFRAFTKENIPPGAIRLAAFLDRIWLAAGGFWAHSDNLSQLERYYRGLRLMVDLGVTPIATDFSAGRTDVYEDGNGDLWLRRYDALFRVKRPRLETRITAPRTAKCTSPTLRVSFAGTCDDPNEGPLAYAWRLDGGPWSQPAEQGYADLEFTQSGPHEFEVLAIGSMGNLDTTPAVLKLAVTLPIPEVRIVSAPRGLVTDLDLAVAYKVVKQATASKVTFQWRLDGGPWQDTQETTIRPPAFEDGEHVLEIRAVADGKYVQAPPESVKFTVKVDYEKAIAAAIEQLSSKDYKQREPAVRRLASLGERCIPYLREALRSADEDTRWWLQAVLEEIER